MNENDRYALELTKAFIQNPNVKPRYSYSTNRLYFIFEGEDRAESKDINDLYELFIKELHKINPV